VRIETRKLFPVPNELRANHLNCSAPNTGDSPTLTAPVPTWVGFPFKTRFGQELSRILRVVEGLNHILETSVRGGFGFWHLIRSTECTVGARGFGLALTVAFTVAFAVA
jgi:hypothetical protein